MTDYLKEARRAKREKDYSKAGDFFYLAGDEKSAMEMYLAGNHYALAARLMEKKGNWKEAAKFYIQSGKYLDAALIYSNKLKDYRAASAMFEKHGDYPRASEMAEKGGEIARAAWLAEKAELWDRAATLYMQAKKLERASEVYYRMFQQLLKEKEEKGFLEHHLSRLIKTGTAAGNLFLKHKNYLKAAECFEGIQNYQKAAECYLLAQQPEKAAEFLYKVQNYEEAYKLLTALGDRCQNKELYADTCFHLGYYQEAGDAYLLAGRNLRAAEAFEEGKNYYRAALLYESLEDYSKSGELYLKLGETKRAAELYEKAKNHEYAAKLFEEIGDIDRAIDCLVSAEQRIRAAEMLIKKEQFQRAVTLLQEITQENDDYLEACTLLGNLFTRMEMYPIAIQKYTEALQSQPLNKENLPIYYGLAVAYEKTANYSRAREIYEKILSVQFGYRDTLARLNVIKNLAVSDGVAAEVTPGSLKKVLGGRYELVEKINKDAFGTLYRARDLSLGRDVMIRRFPEQDKNITRNILEHTKIAATLNHSNILAIYDSGKEEDQYFICTEYVEGQTLRQVLSRGALNVSDICEIASQICLGLAYAHKRNVIHKNLSPENIYVSQGNLVKIANFGFETRWEKGNTPVARQYNSPEQILAHKLDRRTDIYSFGVILYEMVFGAPPFSGPDVELQHVKKPLSIPESSQRWNPLFLVRIIQKCLQKDKQQRYNTADEIVEELEVADIVPGMVLNERYEIIKELGTGGMGRVYQARDRDLDEIVALKVLRAEISADPIIQKRFIREIKVARMITHPFVVKVFDIGKYKGNRYISMEYIQGISLDEWLKNNPGADLRTLLTIVAKVIQGVQAAHSQGIIHRDLKPQNVLLDRSLNPHVLDFGIARSKEIDATASGQVLGSPKYMSPEQIQGKDLDKRSDVYAMGVIMFYMFTGREPFTGDDPKTIIMKHLTQPPPPLREINPAIPTWLEKVVLKALEKDRNQRYSSLKEVLDDLKKGYENHKI